MREKERHLQQKNQQLEENALELQGVVESLHHAQQELRKKEHGLQEKEEDLQRAQEKVYLFMLSFNEPVAYKLRYFNNMQIKHDVNLVVLLRPSCTPYMQRSMEM